MNLAIFDLLVLLFRLIEFFDQIGFLVMVLSAALNYQNGHPIEIDFFLQKLFFQCFACLFFIQKLFKKLLEIKLSPLAMIVS